MRVLLLVIALFTSSIAIANSHYSTYKTRNYTCLQLNQIITSQGIVIFDYEDYFGNKGVHVASENYCGECYSPSRSNVEARDGWCTVGFKCLHNTRITDKEHKSPRQKRRAEMCRYKWRNGILP